MNVTVGNVAGVVGGASSNFTVLDPALNHLVWELPDDQVKTRKDDIDGIVNAWEAQDPEGPAVMINEEGPYLPGPDRKLNTTIRLVPGSNVIRVRAEFCSQIRDSHTRTVGIPV